MGQQVEAAQRTTYGEPLAIYKGASGVTIVSFSEKWASQYDLRKVHDELLENGHGKEMGYLSYVYLYPDAPEGVASLYHASYSKVQGRLIYHSNRYIELFNCNQRANIDEIARDLAHEYGHHFTYYYLIEKKQLERYQWMISQYGQVRDFSSYKQVTFLGDLSKPYQYRWDVAEIIANDYVQLYGSKLARKQIDYLDVQERIERVSVEAYYYDSKVFNLMPQDNMSIPLAMDVAGLYTYFNELSGVQPLGEASEMVVPIPRLDTIINVYKAYNQYIFTWEEILVDWVSATLLINLSNEANHPIPIKTIKKGEPPIGRAGSAVNLKKNTAILENFYGDYNLRLLVTDSDGRIYSSRINYLKINHESNAKKIYTDLENGYWGKEYIYDISNRSLVKGYPDGTFRPEATITRSEFMTILVRTTSLELEKGNGQDWFVKEGYYQQAVKLNLMEAGKEASYYEEIITREEMATMIWQLLVYNHYKVAQTAELKFKDRQEILAELPVKQVVHHKIIEGYPDNTFRPHQSLTRAEAMTIISRLLQL